LDAVLEIAGCLRRDVAACALGEEIELPSDLHGVRFLHQRAHAMTAFYTSPFREAVILVCGRSVVPEMSVWQADKDGVHDRAWPWDGPGFTRLYSQLTEALGFVPGRDEHRVEALARVGNQGCFERVRSLISLDRNRLRIDPRFCERVADLIRSDGQGRQF